MADKQPLSMKLEDYLETILWLVEENRVARARDIAASLSVHKSTVTSALRSLSRKGLINYTAYEAITLTAKGREAAEEIARRHRIIRSFFVHVLAIDEELADANACRMEHILDPPVLERLAAFARFVKACPKAQCECLIGFQNFLGKSRKPATQASQKSAGRKQSNTARKK